MTASLRIIGVFGVMLFGLGLALTFLSPLHYEKAAGGFIEHKLEQRIQKQVDLGENTRLGSFAKTLLEKHKVELTALKERMLPLLKTRITAIVSEMQNSDCECRKRMLQGLTVATSIATKLNITAIEKAEPQVQRLIEGNYGDLVSGLVRDLRIFTGTNLAAFAVLLLLSLVKPGFIRPLFLPAMLLMVATIVSSAIYIFGQNWFFTLLYNDFVGMAIIDTIFSSVPNAIC